MSENELLFIELMKKRYFILDMEYKGEPISSDYTKDELKNIYNQLLQHYPQVKGVDYNDMDSSLFEEEKWWTACGELLIEVVPLQPGEQSCDWY